MSLIFDVNVTKATLDKQAEHGLQDSGNTEENLEQVYLDRSGVAQISFEEDHRIHWTNERTVGCKILGTQRKT